MSLVGDFLGFGSSLLGSGLNMLNQNVINDKNADLQREFAQNSIQWRVQDAQKAGIHPLAALGAGGYQASPSYVGADNGIAQAGQQLSQGLKRELDNDANIASKLNLQKMQLENLKLEKEINEMGYSVSPRNIFGGRSNAPFDNPDASLVDGSKSSEVTHSERVYDVGKGFQINTFPADKNGNPRWFLQPREGSIQAGAMEEADMLGLILSQGAWLKNLIFDDIVTDAERVARKQGFLKDGDNFSRSPFNWSPYGYILKKALNREPKKKIKNYKYTSHSMGF